MIFYGEHIVLSANVLPILRVQPLLLEYRITKNFRDKKNVANRVKATFTKSFTNVVTAHMTRCAEVGGGVQHAKFREKYFLEFAKVFCYTVCFVTMQSTAFQILCPKLTIVLVAAECHLH